MTVLNNLSPQDKADIRRLLETMNLCLHFPTYNLSAYRLANTYQTRYRWVVNDLYDLVTELREIAQDTQENISEVEATLAQYHLKQVLESLILAIRTGRRTCHPSPNRCSH